MKLNEAYHPALEALPPPGGNGFHLAIFRVACIGRDAGVDPVQIVTDLRAHTKPGGRVVPQHEVIDAVFAAFREESHGAPPYAGPRVRPDFLAQCLKDGHGATVDDIARRSPVPLDFSENEGWRVLPFLYAPEELLFIGDDRVQGLPGRSIRPAGEWQAILERLGRVLMPKVIPNPLSGKPAPKKSGEGETYRGDANVAAHRFAVAECDSMSLEDQLAFWMGCPSLPVVALILSGKKSVHAWLRADCKDSAAWEREIAGKLFPSFLVPLGMDPACKNPARLSRMPGHLRRETGQVQQIIYLAPKGKAVNS